MRLFLDQIKRRVNYILATKLLQLAYILARVGVNVPFISAHTQTLPYLNRVCTATMVLQSARYSSSSELELSLFTTTMLSAQLTPAFSQSSSLHRVISVISVDSTWKLGFVSRCQMYYLIYLITFHVIGVVIDTSLWSTSICLPDIRCILLTYCVLHIFVLFHSH